jgi:hypothetical protein
VTISSQENSYVSLQADQSRRRSWIGRRLELIKFLRKLFSKEFQSTFWVLELNYGSIISKHVHFLNLRDIIDSQALQSLLKLLIIASCAFVDGLSLPASGSLATNANILLQPGELRLVHPFVGLHVEKPRKKQKPRHHFMTSSSIFCCNFTIEISFQFLSNDFIFFYFLSIFHF